MSKNSFVPKILSPEEAKDQLTIPCLMILLGIAQPVFPYTDRSKPSPVVLIYKVLEVRMPDGIPEGILPVPVEGKQWRDAVVPVLEDETWRTTNPINFGTLTSGYYIELFGKALKMSFENAGWGIDG